MTWLRRFQLTLKSLTDIYLQPLHSLWQQVFSFNTDRNGYLLGKQIRSAKVMSGSHFVFHNDLLYDELTHYQHFCATLRYKQEKKK